MKLTPVLPALSALALLASAPISRTQIAAPTLIYAFPATGYAGAGGGLIQDGSGTLYGTTAAGGTAGDGSIFSVTLDGNASILYSFSGGDGANPNAGLLRTDDGTLYGTTAGGGSGDGTIFKLTPDGVFTTLHSFDGTDGQNPAASLTLGNDGNFYGTTAGNLKDTGDSGTVFQLTPAGVLTTLHNFEMGDGINPASGLALGSDGNFYGTTPAGGVDFEAGFGNGTVYSITSGGMFAVLHFFERYEGSNSVAGLLQGGDGAFYGVNYLGGGNGAGNVFKVTADGAFTVLHTFAVPDANGLNGDGAYPAAALVDGGDGYFYGSTSGGGSTGAGTIFSLTPAGVLTTLYTFSALDGSGNNVEGAHPAGRLLKGSDGRFYCALPAGGVNGQGTIDAFTVSGAPPAFFAGQVPLGGGAYYLSFPSGNYFGYYSDLTDPAYLYHFDLGYEYVFDANDGQSGVYLYDFASSDFFYTSPVFPFPYLYDFNLNSVVYYYPDPNNAGHYNTNGVRYFYVFSTGQIISK